MKHLLVTILSLLFFSTFLGQKYNFNNFEIDEVGAKYIYAFSQDSKNKLFMATSRGLLKYDGIKFQIVDKHHGLKDNFVSQIYIDTQNRIWVAYYNKGVSKLTETYNGFTSEYYDIPAVLSISEDEKGMRFITVESTFARYDEQENEMLFSINELTTLRVRKEIILKNNKRIHLTDRGVYYKENDHYKAIEGTEDRYIRTIKRIKNTNTFTFLADDEIKIFKYNDKLRFINSININKIGISDKVTDIELDKQRMVISTLGQGIFEINFIDERMQAYNFINYKEENGLQSNDVQSLYIDNEKNLWIGYYGYGVSMFYSQRSLWYDETTGLENENIHTVTTFNGNLAVGTDNGFSIIDHDSIKNYNQTSGNFVSDRVNVLYAQNETLWIGTESRGLFMMKNNKITPFVFTSIQDQPITINTIVINNNKLYVGTNSGLYSHVFSTGKEVHLTTNEGLVHNVIEYIFIDSKGRFWFDSPVSPIYSYYNGEFTLHKDIEGFDSYDLSQIYETKDKEILFSTMGDGLIRFRDGEFSYFQTRNSQLFSDYVYFITEDVNHKIWLGHRKGISRFNKNNETFDAFLLESNPLLKGVNPKAVQPTVDNSLWIGTEEGLVKLNTKNLAVSAQKPPKLSYKGLLVDDTMFITQKEIELPYSNYQLEFLFQSILLSHPKGISYQYKLEGFDKKWNTVSYDTPVAKYQSVTNGRYTFRLKVCMEYACSEEEIVIQLHIKKPFWKTPAAFMLITLLVLGLFFLIIYIITSTKNKQNRVLELKVKRRTQELSKTNRLIEQKNQTLEKINKKVIEQKDKLEQKNKEIDDSIQYAKRIQKAFILKDEYAEWEKFFSSTVIFDKPRDSVSGDFYWGHKSKQYLYIAVADCTGHGVPGAMLSMLGIAFLDQLMIQYPTIETNELLDKLREKMITELSHEEENIRVREGMDISLCRIDTQTMEMQWSGANNPLYFIRKEKDLTEEFAECKITVGENGFALAEFKADKQPIGFAHEIHPFTKRTIHLKKGDAFYLFSDGYSDQFGGERYKKFMTKNLKKLLLSIHHLEGSEQYIALEETHENWKGDNFQIDDICVVGLKL